MLLSFATHCLITWRFFTIANGYTAPWPIKPRLNLKVPITDSSCMKTALDAHRRKICALHLTYSAFSLVPRGRTTGFLPLTAVAKNSIWFCPVKQKRALLKSNPPRDNWIEGDEIKNVSAFGEAQTSPKVSLETFISEPEHALQNSSETVSKSSKSFRDGQHQQKTLRKNYASSYPFFRSKPTHDSSLGQFTRPNARYRKAGQG